MPNIQKNFKNYQTNLLLSLSKNKNTNKKQLKELLNSKIPLVVFNAKENLKQQTLLYKIKNIMKSLKYKINKFLKLFIVAVGVIYILYPSNFAYAQYSSNFWQVKNGNELSPIPPLILTATSSNPSPDLPFRSNPIGIWNETNWSSAINSVINTVATWKSNVTYILNDVVNYAGNLYTSVLSNNLNNLPTNTAAWKLTNSNNSGSNLNGTGTINYIPIWNGTSTLGTSTLFINNGFLTSLTGIIVDGTSTLPVILTSTSTTVATTSTSTTVTINFAGNNLRFTIPSGGVTELDQLNDVAISEAPVNKYTQQGNNGDVGNWTQNSNGNWVMTVLLNDPSQITAGTRITATNDGLSNIYTVQSIQGGFVANQWFITTTATTSGLTWGGQTGTGISANIYTVITQTLADGVVVTWNASTSKWVANPPQPARITNTLQVINSATSSNIISTINGVIASGTVLFPTFIQASTTNQLSYSANNSLLTSTVDGVVATTTITTGAGTINGTGTVNYIPIWTGTSTLGTTTLFLNNGFITSLTDLIIDGNRVGNGAGNNISNSVLGASALSDAGQNGNGNTAIGNQSLFSNISGSNNTGLGATTLYNNTSGQRNTAVGVSTLSGITSGNNNIGLGYDVEVLQPNGVNQLNIGNWIYGNNGNIAIGSSTAPYNTNPALLFVNGTSALPVILTATSTSVSTTSTSTTVTISFAGNNLRFTIPTGGATELDQLTDVSVTEPTFSQLSGVTVASVSSITKSIVVSENISSVISVGDWLLGGTTSPGKVGAIQVIGVFNTNLEFSVDPTPFFAVNDNIYRLDNTINGNSLVFDNSVNRWVPKPAAFQIGLDVISWIDRLGNTNRTNTNVNTQNVYVTTNSSVITNGWTFNVPTISGFTSNSSVVLIDNLGRIASGVYLSASDSGGSFATLDQVVVDRVAGGGFATNTAYFVTIRQGQDAIRPIVQKTQSFLPNFESAYLSKHNVDSSLFWGFLTEGAGTNGNASIELPVASSNESSFTGLQLNWVSGTPPSTLTSGSSVVVFDLLGRFNISNAVISQVSGVWYLEGEFNTTESYDPNNIFTIPAGTYTVSVNGVDEQAGFSLNGVHDDVVLVAGEGIGLSINGNEITITNTGTATGTPVGSPHGATSWATDNFTSYSVAQQPSRYVSTDQNSVVAVLPFNSSGDVASENTGEGTINGITYISQGTTQNAGNGFSFRFPQTMNSLSDIDFKLYINNLTLSLNTTGTLTDVNEIFFLPMLTSVSTINNSLDPTFHAIGFFDGAASNQETFYWIKEPTITITGTSPNQTVTLSNGIMGAKGDFEQSSYTGSNTDYYMAFVIGTEEVGKNITGVSSINITKDRPDLFSYSIDMHIGLQGSAGGGNATQTLAQVLSVGNTTGLYNLNFSSTGKLSGGVEGLNIGGGLSGQVLTTDGNGNQSWTNKSGGASYDWVDYNLRGRVSTSTNITGSATGTVYTTLWTGGTMVYRFVSTAKTTVGSFSYPTEDSYYSTWAGGNNKPTTLLGSRYP